jgi:hypothetical protein
VCWDHGIFEMISIRFLVPRMCSARILAIARDSIEPIGKPLIYAPSGNTLCTASSRFMPCGTPRMQQSFLLPSAASNHSDLYGLSCPGDRGLRIRNAQILFSRPSHACLRSYSCRSAIRRAIARDSNEPVAKSLGFMRRRPRRELFPLLLLPTRFCRAVAKDLYRRDRYAQS